jgi:hypothetical protein
LARRAPQSQQAQGIAPKAALSRLLVLRQNVLLLLLLLRCKRCISLGALGDIL